MSPEAKLRLALDMYEFGEQALRIRLKRLRPAASEEETEKAVREWRVSRPGAPIGDAVGRPSPRFA
jgi:Rv0078B-related antitoxin